MKAPGRARSQTPASQPTPDQPFVLMAAANMNARGSLLNQGSPAVPAPPAESPPVGTV